MPSNRSFWIITRIAVAEGVLIFVILVYFLQSNAGNSETLAFSLSIIAIEIAGVLLFIAERKYKNTN